MSKEYDYIIVGAGCAGLSLLMRMLDDPFFIAKKILLTDRVQKNLDDRTWCFWEKNTGYFESLIHHKWEQLFVLHKKGEVTCKMGGYAYKMIKGIDFYNHCFSQIKSHKNVDVIYGETTGINSETGEVNIDGKSYSCQYVFSSVLPTNPILKKNEFYLLQHFKGWWIETEEEIFDPGKADLMNFRVSQEYGCAFVYVMPVSRNKALIEYTLFSEETLASEVYEQQLANFIKEELKIDNYGITYVENGIIPMTNYRFTPKDGKVIYIGTAGGQTKGSTGYTFQNIQKHSTQIVKALTISDEYLLAREPAAKFRFYDGVLLRVLHERKIAGSDIFYAMFSKNAASKVLRFLDNESSFADEIAIMFSTPKHVFGPAAVSQMV